MRGEDLRCEEGSTELGEGAVGTRCDLVDIGAQNVGFTGEEPLDDLHRHPKTEDSWDW